MGNISTIIWRYHPLKKGLRLALFFGVTVVSGCHSPVQESTKSPAPPHLRSKQIFLVMDDGGLSLSETQQFLDIPISMTIAVLPHLKETKQVCYAISRHADKEIILHQPMEAYSSKVDLGPGAIYNTTVAADISGIIARNLASVQGAVGVNNHMGSRVTENPELMHAILLDCRARNLFFLDSKTSYNSHVPPIAQQLGVHLEQRHVFLDIKHDRESIRKMWGQAVAKAQKNGYVIVIGHVWSTETAATLRDSFKTLQNQGYTFHRLSELYK